MDERLDPVDHDMMRDRRVVKRHRKPIKISWRFIGCMGLLVALIMGCAIGRAAFEGIAHRIDTWRNPAPTPTTPPRVILPTPTPPVTIITPQPGNKTSADHTPCPVAPG